MTETETPERRVGGMFTARETARLIREMADREGKNGLTIRHVDPATLSPSKVKAETAPRPLAGPQASDLNRLRDTKEERHDHGRTRAAVIAYLDSREGIPTRRGEIADAVSLSPHYLTQLLRELTDHGHINAAGITTARRYWRGKLKAAGSPAPDTPTVAEVRHELERELAQPSPTELAAPDIFAVLERAHRAEKCVMVFGTALEWIARHPDATDRLRVAIRETLEQT